MSANPNESAPVIYLMDEMSEEAKQAVLNHLLLQLPLPPIKPETAFDSYGERYGDWFLNRFCTFAFDRAPVSDDDEGVGENGLKDREASA